METQRPKNKLWMPQLHVFSFGFFDVSRKNLGALLLNQFSGSSRGWLSNEAN